MICDVVIGANYGDEGKGRIVSHLAASHGTNCIVVRFNGGAQAAHTVVTPQHRHVFHTYGSGTLTGASTYLTYDVIINPIVWYDEFMELSLKARLELVVHPRARVTTPYDMLINQEVEKHRLSERHGSCGLGIHETMHRHIEHPLIAKDLQTIREPTKNIRDLYIKKRMEEYGIPITNEFYARYMAPELLDYFESKCTQMATHIDLQDYSYLNRAKKIVFEGAQGLLLDQDHPNHPHVTHSKTGRVNASKVLEWCNFNANYIYITRSYLTRHGAGPFPEEDTDLNFEDKTNTPNTWQGNLRYGRLDVKELNKRIKEDLDGTVGGSLAVTCLDQHPNLMLFLQEADYPVCLASYGPGTTMEIVNRGF